MLRRYFQRSYSAEKRTRSQERLESDGSDCDDLIRQLTFEARSGGLVGGKFARKARIPQEAVIGISEEVSSAAKGDE